MLYDDHYEDVFKHLLQGRRILTEEDLAIIDEFVVTLIGKKVHKMHEENNK